MGANTVAVAEHCYCPRGWRGFRNDRVRFGEDSVGGSQIRIRRKIPPMEATTGLPCTASACCARLGEEALPPGSQTAATSSRRAFDHRCRGHRGFGLAAARDRVTTTATFRVAIERFDHARNAHIVAQSDRKPSSSSAPMASRAHDMHRASNSSTLVSRARRAKSPSTARSRSGMSSIRPSSAPAGRARWSRSYPVSPTGFHECAGAPWPAPHVVPDERLHGRLVLANAEHMNVHLQLSGRSRSRPFRWKSPPAGSDPAGSDRARSHG